MSLEWEKAVSFIKEYEWLIEFKIVDFITSSYWDRSVIPEEWKVFVKGSESEDFANILMQLADPFTYQDLPLPPSLKLFRNHIEQFNEQIGRYSCDQHLNVVSQRRKNMREKKTYEIETLTTVISDLVEEGRLNRAVDVGSGQGYLAMELLKRNEDLSIVGIECADRQIHGTNERLKDCSENVRERFQMKKIFLTGDAEQWNSLVESATSQEEYLIYSLHACGSLSESMLTSFCAPSVSKARILFNLPCCYNLINESLPGAHFPLSSAMRSVWEDTILEGVGGGLSRNMKMVACQSPARWIHRPSQTRTFFIRHFYRALLEQLLIVHYGRVGIEDSECINGEGGRMEKISACYLDSFTSYAQRALQSLNLPPLDPDILTNFYKRHIHLKGAIAFLWTMRALMGSVVEDVILWDRLLFAKEQLIPEYPNAHITIRPVLHHLKSPRNLALIIHRDGLKSELD